MRVLVTGGAGFIGSHIVDTLVKAGATVSIVDNLTTSFIRNINPRARFYKTDILSNELQGVFENERPETVFHEAAHTVVTRSLSDPDYDARVNILGSVNIIENCVKFGVKKLIYASSCALYGKPVYLPVDEAHPVNPLAPYGISKHTVEHYLSVAGQLKGLSYVVLRYANVYGPRQNPRGEGGVVAIFAGKMLSGGQPVIYGQGNKTRDYIYVGDVVRANMLALESEKSGIYNIGTGMETTDQKIFDLICSECGFGGLPIYSPERPGEIQRMFLDSSGALKELGWKSAVALKEGIARTVAYYREALVNA